MDPGLASPVIFNHSLISTDGETSEDDNNDGEEELEGFLVPIWQYGPSPKNATLISLDLLSDHDFRYAVGQSFQERKVEFSKAKPLRYFRSFAGEDHHATEEENVHSFLSVPVFEDFIDDAAVVGFAIGIFPWASLFNSALPECTKSFVATVGDNCGTHVSFIIDGPVARRVPGDMHDHKYDALAVKIDYGQEDQDEDGCFLVTTLYATIDLQAQYKTNAPAL